MSEDMGAFRLDVEVENLTQPGARRVVPGLLVDTGAELSWVPGEVLDALGIAPVKRARFRQATGAIVERWIGEVRLHAVGRRTVDEVVFGEPGDQSLLGARTLEGLNLIPDPISKRLIDAGAMPAAVGLATFAYAVPARGRIPVTPSRG